MIKLFFILFSTLIFGQFRYLKDSELKQFNLSGNVKEVETITIFYKNNDNLQNYKRIQLYCFDKSGRLITEKVNGEINGKNTVETVTINEFDEISRFISSTYTSEYGTKIRTFTYPKDSIVIINEKGNNKFWEEKYIQKKNIEYGYVKSDEESRKIICEYDHRNRIVNWSETTFYNSQKLQENIKSTYSGKCQTPTNEDYGNFLVNNILDKQCNPIKTTHFSKKENKIRGESNFVYTYDEKNNWTERKKYDSSGKLWEVATRKITYY